MASKSAEGVITSLKIQVDNNTAAVEKPSIEEDNELEEGEATGTDSEDEVEVNVVIGSSRDLQKSEPYGERTRHAKSSRAIQNFYRVQQDASKYPTSSEFGSDPFSVAPYEDQLDKRAIRFGMENHSSVPKSEMVNLLQSLDLTRDDFLRGGWRPEAIHLLGIEKLKSDEIFEYFRMYSPASIEWLNKDACNVVFSRNTTAAKALVGLSCPIIRKKKLKEAPMKKVVETKEKSKVKKSAECNVESSASDHSSSSSDTEESDEDGSSSDSSSSSGSSSSSAASSGNSSESSSDSSSSETDEDEKPEPTKSTSANKVIPDNENNGSLPMEVEQLDEQIGSIREEDVGIPIPPGKWRLGIPCPNTKALLMRYAHCKDKKVPGLQKPVDFFEVHKPLKASRQRRDRTTEVKREKTNKGMFARHHRERPEWWEKARMEMPLQPFKQEIGVGYVDLDDPFDSPSKNPWGFLAHNWSRKETQDNLDYQALLQEHLLGSTLGRKRKRKSDTESVDESPPRKYLPMTKNPKEFHSEDDYNDHEESDALDEVDEWRSKIKLPRMRMYADSEEKRRYKRKTALKTRLGMGEWSEPISRPRMSAAVPVFDLRAKLQNKGLRSRRRMS